MCAENSTRRYHNFVNNIIYFGFSSTFVASTTSLRLLNISSGSSSSTPRLLMSPSFSSSFSFPSSSSLSHFGVIKSYINFMYNNNGAA